MLQTKRLNVNTSGLQSPRVQLLAASMVAYLQSELPPSSLLNGKALSKGDPNCDMKPLPTSLVQRRKEGGKDGGRKGREERQAWS